MTKHFVRELEKLKKKILSLGATGGRTGLSGNQSY